MTFLLPTPRLMKLRPTPHWSMPSAPGRRHPAAAATPSGGTAAGLAAGPAPWGTCDIVLVAERQQGATHKFFHDWRFEAVMRHGEPEPGTVLARSLIPPVRRQTAAAMLTPAAVAVQFHAGADPTGAHPEAFTWTPPLAADPDATDPLVKAWTRLRQQLGDAGWQPEDASAVRFQKPAPVGPASGAASAGANLDLATNGGPDGAS